MRKTGYSSLLMLAVICISTVLLVGCKDNKQLDKNPSLTKTPDSNKSITEAAKPSKGEIMSQQSDEAAKDANPRIIMETSMGNIELELDAKAAPVTVKNFLRYVNEDFFNGTIFHRVISNFMIQGGGFTEDMNKKGTHASIINEAVNGLKNDRGTIAMARTSDPDSATAQFFINVKDNDSLNYSAGNPGYAVFGKVVEGMDVVDAIRAVKTTTRKGMGDVPVDPVVIKKVSVKK